MFFRNSFLFLSPIYKFKIFGNSMLPAMKAGDSVLVNRMAYWFRHPKINDIVALRDPRDGKVLTKRIIKIEDKGYFVQGDNKNASTDSRVFGILKKRDIIGKVIR
jgi:nickel-type superoxide dismutase maturation protease